MEQTKPSADYRAEPSQTTISNENCHCEKKKNQGEGRVKEKRTKMAALMKTGTPNININKQIYWWEEIPINTNKAQLGHFSLLGLITLPGPYLIGVHTHAY